MTSRTHTCGMRLAWVAVLVAAVLQSGCAMFGGERPEPLSVPQMLEMHKAGVPADEIVAAMKASGTVYRLKASQLAELREQGVPDAVIDHMQGTYLDAVRRDASYDEWRQWTLHHNYWYGGAPFGWPRERFIIRPRAR